jgi:OOP family OmpA-OmpF porin
MRVNKRKVAATMVAAAFAAGSAQAAEKGFYFGGSVGQTTVSINDVNFDKSDTGWKAFVGYNFLPYFGVEAGYVDFGSPSDNGFGGQNIQVELSGEELFLVGDLPIGPVDLFVKAGGIQAKAQIHAGFFGSEDDNDQYAAWGAGVAYNFAKKFAVRAEYEGYHASNVDQWYLLSIGLTYHL